MSVDNKNKLTELYPNQDSPRQAKPSDFSVLETEDPNPYKYQFSGQCGDSKQEYDALLSVREIGHPARKSNEDKLDEPSVKRSKKSR